MSVYDPERTLRALPQRSEWALSALQRKVTRLKEKSGFSSSLPPVRQLYRANFPPTQTPLPPAFFVGNRFSKRRDRMTDGVIRKFATDVDEPVLAEPRKGFFVRFMEALRRTRRRQARREIAKHANLLSNVVGEENSAVPQVDSQDDPLEIVVQPDRSPRESLIGTSRRFAWNAIDFLHPRIDGDP